MTVLKNVLGCSLTALLLASCVQVDPPAPYGAVPSEQQVNWQKMEYYMFIHFGPNTFTNVDWGNGKEDPKVFNPTNLDCRQWASVAKDAGMKAIILTAKHHDGFCLWPSKYSTHTVRESLWKDGKGDLMKELSEACKEYGLKFGVYLSPWDQNHPSYGTPEYNQVFANTLTEVLTQYGEVFEQWFDGANGYANNGYKPTYDWDLFHQTVYKHQPQIIVFSDNGPDIRWMGNERGVMGETNWSTFNVAGFGKGVDAPPREVMNTGVMNGEKWIPAEVDVSIRPKWFYTPDQDNKVKSVENLTEIYYTSIGRNANLLLNIPPNREGRIHPIDSAHLMGFRKVIDESFSRNLIEGAKLKASNTRGNASRYGVKHLQDNKFESYWATNDDVQNASIEIILPKPESFNRFQVQEYIPLGQRVVKFSVDMWNEQSQTWQKLTEGTTIGYKRILRFPQVTAKKLRLNIDESLACPVLNGIGIYKAVEFLSVPTVKRDMQGTVTMSCPTSDPVIYYTLDGSQPTASSTRYQQPFSLPGRAVVRAVAMVDNNKSKSDETTMRYEIAPTKWKLVSPLKAPEIIDGNTSNKTSIDKATAIIIDLGEKLTLKGFIYTPQAHTEAPNIYQYTFSVSNDNKQWTQVKKAALFNNIQNNPIPQEIVFDKPAEAQYIKLEALGLANPGKRYVVSEVSVITE